MTAERLVCDWKRIRVRAPYRCYADTTANPTLDQTQPATRLREPVRKTQLAALQCAHGTRAQVGPMADEIRTEHLRGAIVLGAETIKALLLVNGGAAAGPPHVLWKLR